MNVDIQCKSCFSHEHVRNGKVRGRQRYKCKQCDLNFIEGDRRALSESRQIVRLTSILFHLMGKASFRFIAKQFNVSPTSVYQWVKSEVQETDDPLYDKSIKEIETDDLCRLLKSEKSKDGSSNSWYMSYAKPTADQKVILLIKKEKT